MKSYKNLFERVCSFGNLVNAYRKARLGKRDRPEVYRFDLRQEEELIALERELREGVYRPGEYRSFLIFDPKRRLISAAPFRDRVVHHAICNVIEPILDRQLVFDTYACRKGKGTHRALDRSTQYARRFPYVLKADIVQYFASIDHEILLGLLRRRIADEIMLALIRRIVESGRELLKDEYRMAYFAGDDLFARFRPRGLPIGNLPSQIFANLYLDSFDHWVKEELRERAYIRYCDDFVLFGTSRAHLEETRERMRGFLSRLRLRLHPTKSVVYRVQDGVPFLGFLLFPTHRRLLRKSVTRAARRFRRLADAYADGDITLPEVRQRVMAWLGHVRHGDTWGLRRKLLGSLKLRRRRYDPRNPDLREDVRLEPLVVSKDDRLPEATPPFADGAP